MRYREATSDDTEAVARLHAESWSANYRGAASDEFLDGPVFEDRRTAWTERLSAPNPDQFVILAEESRDLLGFACAYGNEDVVRGTYFDNFHVRAEYQGRGIGRELFAGAVAWSVDRYPHSGMYLLVLAQNDRARRFYEKHGATDAETATWEPPGGGVAESRIYTWTNDQLAQIRSQAGATG
jgi:GNAT superfamily N-acetyltransferase